MNTDDVWLKQKPEPQVECIYFSKAFYNLIFFLPAVIIYETTQGLKWAQVRVYTVQRDLIPNENNKKNPKQNKTQKSLSIFRNGFNTA